MRTHLMKSIRTPRPIARKIAAVDRARATAVLLATLILGMLTSGVRATSASAAGVIESPSAASPLRSSMLRRDWLGDVIDVIDDVVEILEEADDEIEASGEEIDDVEESVILDKLDLALDRIDVLLDPDTSPRLEPFDVGTIDTSVSPQTLEQYAGMTLDLALDAMEHLETAPQIDTEYVGTLVKTIAHLICRGDPHCYRGKVQER